MIPDECFSNFLPDTKYCWSLTAKEKRRGGGGGRTGHNWLDMSKDVCQKVENWMSCINGRRKWEMKCRKCSMRV